MHVFPSKTFMQDDKPQVGAVKRGVYYNTSYQPYHKTVFFIATQSEASNRHKFLYIIIMSHYYEYYLLTLIT